MQANIDGSWPSITDDSIVSFEGTIQELMDQAGVDTVEDLVWINLQMWNVSIGDQIAYKYTITPADETEDEDLISGTTDDGTKYQQLPADDSTSTNNYIGDTYPAKTVIDNKTYANVRDGGENWRIYRAVSTEDLANYSSASVVIKNSDTGKAFKLTTSTVYQVLNDGDPPIDGVVYVVFVINNVSGYHKTSNSYNSDLVWSDITLE